MMDYDTYLDVGQRPRGFSNRPGNRASLSQRIIHGATQLGISVEAYEMHLEAGERWCSGHQRWCPAQDFSGKKGSCRAGHAAYMREYDARKRAGGGG